MSDDKKRLTVKEVLQLEFFVTDETSAIQWLKQQLTKKPQTFQELHPQFLKEIGGWQKYEKPLELSELLEENFLRYTGTGEVPSQIHSYLSTNFKELRNLSSKYSVNPLSPSAKKALSRKSWYIRRDGKHSAPRDIPFRADARARHGHAPLCPTDGGADETGLYRTYVAGELLASAVRATAGAGSRLEGGSRSPAGHDP